MTIHLWSLRQRLSRVPDYAPVPRSLFGPTVNDQGCYVGRVERNLYNDQGRLPDEWIRTESQRPRSARC